MSRAWLLHASLSQQYPLSWELVRKDMQRLRLAPDWLNQHVLWPDMSCGLFNRRKALKIRLQILFMSLSSSLRMHLLGPGPHKPPLQQLTPEIWSSPYLVTDGVWGLCVNYMVAPLESCSPWRASSPTSWGKFTNRPTSSATFSTIPISSAIKCSSLLMMWTFQMEIQLSLIWFCSLIYMSLSYGARNGNTRNRRIEPSPQPYCSSRTM